MVFMVVILSVVEDDIFLFFGIVDDICGSERVF